MIISGIKRRSEHDACGSYIIDHYTSAMSKFIYLVSYFCDCKITIINNYTYPNRTKIIFRNDEEFTGTYINRKI